MMNKGLNYLCTVYREIPTGQTRSDDSLITKMERIGDIPCSFPEERSRQVSDIDRVVDVDILVLRVGLNANVLIGDHLRGIRDALNMVVFDDMEVLVPNLKRTHTEVRARRIR